jgi:hypothetical protein
MKNFLIICLVLLAIVGAFIASPASAEDELRGILKDVMIYTDGSVKVWLTDGTAPRRFERGTYIFSGVWQLGKPIVIYQTVSLKWKVVQQTDFILHEISRFRQYNRTGYATLLAWGTAANFGTTGEISWLAFSTSDGKVEIVLSGSPPASQLPALKRETGKFGWRIYQNYAYGDKSRDRVPILIVGGNWDVPVLYGGKSLQPEKKKEEVAKIITSLKRVLKDVEVKEYLD